MTLNEAAEMIGARFRAVTGHSGDAEFATLPPGSGAAEACAAMRPMVADLFERPEDVDAFLAGLRRMTNYTTAAITASSAPEPAIIACLAQIFAVGVVLGRGQS